MKRALLVIAGIGILFACATDVSIRSYIRRQFWLPFAKNSAQIPGGRLQRQTTAFAGMTGAAGNSPLDRLRSAYQTIATPQTTGIPLDNLRALVDAARKMPSLSPREREEIELIDAKIDVRLALPADPQPFAVAKAKLTKFLRNSRVRDFQSEARGWLAYVHYLLGEQTEAGKIYLSELRNPNTVHSRESLLNSLAMTYDYDGGEQLRANVHRYFDHPANAAFAIQLATNPPRDAFEYFEPDEPRAPAEPLPYARINELLSKNAHLFGTESGARILAVLGMRIALHASDLPSVIRIANGVPPQSAVRSDPDFLWMLASAHYLSKEWTQAEVPLRQLLRSRAATDSQRAAAAFGLFAAARKQKNWGEQIRYGLWLDSEGRRTGNPNVDYGRLSDLSIYWGGPNTLDRALLLDAEVPLEAMQEFVRENPKLPNIFQVRYAIAVRLARLKRYEESAQAYDALNITWRAERMRRLAALELAATTPKGKLALAQYIAANQERLFFNDRLWNWWQRYGLSAERENRFSKDEREAQIALERDLRDAQEERWQAYLILRGLVDDPEIGRDAARLAVDCLERISERFNRTEEIIAERARLLKFLRAPRK